MNTLYKLGIFLIVLKLACANTINTNRNEKATFVFDPAANATVVPYHGYASTPLARQQWCNIQGGFWWPESGSAIPNDMCRLAYQYVRSRGNDGTVQFVQSMEFAAMAGSNYNDLSHIKNNVIPDTLCGAGAKGQNNFGDKSGMALAGNWQKSTLFNNKMDMIFCATAPHEPSFWQVFITKPTFDVATQVLTWNDLDMIYERFDVDIELGIFNDCSTLTAYRLEDVTLPARSNPFIIYIRWQRQDPAGEGFYNCIDAQFF